MDKWAISPAFRLAYSLKDDYTINSRYVTRAFSQFVLFELWSGRIGFIFMSKPNGSFICTTDGLTVNIFCCFDGLSGWIIIPIKVIITQTQTYMPTFCFKCPNAVQWPDQLPSKDMQVNIMSIAK